MIMGRLLSASMDGKRVWVESGEGMGGGVMTFTCTTSGLRRLDIDIASAVGLDITVASFRSSRGLLVFAQGWHGHLRLLVEAPTQVLLCWKMLYHRKMVIHCGRSQALYEGGDLMANHA